MEKPLPYDKTSPKSIEAYAKKLLNKSLYDVLGSEIKQTYKGKGKLGQALEELYFQYMPNSKSEPDFVEAGVELKTSPLKKITRGLVSKERLVFNIIDYKKEHLQEFRTSNFWRKNHLLLLMFFLHDPEKIDLEYLFKIITLWEFPVEDLKIIKDDWEKVIAKIKAGKAHEISEGDTLYLGACTKGANRESLTSQPFSSVMAMQRAFSLKSKYLNFIIEKYFAGEKFKINQKGYNKILGDDYTFHESSVRYQKLDLEDVEPVVKSIKDYRQGETFEDLVIRRFSKHYGKTEKELIKELGIKETNAKHKYSLIAKAIMGVKKGKEIEEFEKADMIMKTIRLENSGSLKESMSFAQIKFKEIIHESWEDSYWFNTITKRFFFVVFQKNENGDLELKKVIFWTMPYYDIETGKKFWEDTKKKIKNDDYQHFIKASDDRIFHIRPKAINNKDLMETPSGRMEKKKCYWLNASYIKNIIS
ncbi:MAG TPA: MutH/Sau3AI family endonuclease [Bacteroidia bacterium]|jgi:DNA mismatch repair protein MutH|nr:MutH/Sau3AI family endonuclease [Bacteroidia bacterium]